MESFRIENLSFTYPNGEEKTLKGINTTINQGEFVTLCGKSGCGKTTLLRLLKSSLAPHGILEGKIFFEKKLIDEYDIKAQTEKIGFVMQNPDNQIVTDKVWHELAFGLESLGYSTDEIRVRVSEMASFFGIQTWFYKNTSELSGGQKQLLNLASVMAMQPSVLILDEPTSQLDPISAQEFLRVLSKINRELGITVIICEHRLEEVFPISDRVIVMENGEIIIDEEPKNVGKILKNKKHDMYEALPCTMRIYGALESGNDYPVSVREGRKWFETFASNNKINAELIPKTQKREKKEVIIEIKDAWFRYEKALPDVIKGLNMKVTKGEIFAVVGGNGTGKTTALSLISGLYTPYRGEILIKGTPIKEVKDLYNGVLGALPQNPQSIFVKKTVFSDLYEILSERKISKEEKENMVYEILHLCHLENVINSHPYDLSGGEQQRAALAKVLLKNPEILILDEPTKGMDAHFKEEFASVLNELRSKGVTIIIVSHDIEFCAKYADKCSLFFDGNITSSGEAREFFAGNSFYTTATNRMARGYLKNAVLADDIILACGGEIEKKERAKSEGTFYKKNNEKKEEKLQTKKLTPLRIIFGIVFLLLYLLTSVSFATDYDILRISKIGFLNPITISIISVAEIALSLFCFFPRRKIGCNDFKQIEKDTHLTKRTIFAAFLILLIIPLTIFLGIKIFGDRKYYFICLLIILETMIPFFMVFESRRPKARELVLISALCAICVAGRMAFFMLPQFKPVVALVIIAGVCLGGETGFLVGTVTGFISNFFFGQGPYTPWQMFAFGIIGFLAGVLFKKGLLKKSRATLSVFGFFAAFIIYGGIMNPAAVIMTQTELNIKMLMASYISGIPFDIIHAVSTAFFLWFISEPMIDKLERIKIKYGLIEKHRT